MRLADRLFEIVQHLRGDRLVTAQMLADKLEVSVRTIYRDVRDLQTAGVPIDAVFAELRRRFGISGIDERASRKK